jgi:hypothetical protein
MTIALSTEAKAQDFCSLREDKWSLASPIQPARPILRIGATDADRRNLSATKIPVSSNPVRTDYASMIVNKPWGYEYQLFDNFTVGVWILHLRPGAATSMHCHTNKATSLVVLSGGVAISTLGNLHMLDAMNGVRIDAGVFHSTRALTPSGAFVLEMENPSCKHDVVRLRDDYGREASGYEGESAHSFDLHNYTYVNFGVVSEESCTRVLDGRSISIQKLRRGQLLSGNLNLSKEDVVGVCSGAVADDTGAVLVGSGAICRAEELLTRPDAHTQGDVDVLTIGTRQVRAEARSLRGG